MRWRLSALAQHLANTKGQVLIFVALSSFVLIGFAALSTDFGNYSNERQRLQNALDAAALAGAQHLPLRASNAAEAALMFADADADARKFAKINDDKLDLGRLTVNFGCLVKANEDGLGGADPIEILTLCPQLQVEAAAFTCQNNRCFHDCPVSLTGAVGEALQKCNTIRVQASKEVSLFLAPVVGAVGSTTTNLEGVACRGSTCGAPAEAAIVMMIDRSNSMGEGGDPNRLDQAKLGAISILNADFLVPELHVVALATTPLAPGNDQHVLAPSLTPNYDELIGTVNLLVTQPGQTDLHTPIEEATALLTTNPLAAGKSRVIILLTDGVPNTIGPACTQALDAADAAKAQEIQIYTIFYGTQELQNQTCPDDGTLTAVALLARMASGSSQDNPNCVDESSHTDHFSCASDGEDLAPIFQGIIRQVTVGDGSSLIDLTGFI